MSETGNISVSDVWKPQTPLEVFSKAELGKLKTWGQSEEYGLLMKWFYKQLEFNLLSSLGNTKEKQESMIAEANALKTSMQMVQSLPNLAGRKLGEMESKENR